MDEELKDEILKSISLGGGIEQPTINPIIGNRPELVLELRGGLPRIKRSLIDKFSLILSQPLIIRALSNLSIRCCLCGAVIRYPAWYASIRYNVNWFHYFICFDGNNSTKPTARCYRR